MYNYLPTDDSPYHANFHTPQKIIISAPPNTLKQQQHTLGTYTIINGRECNGKPMYKHATADLVVAHALKVGENEEEGWVVAKWSTFGVKDHRCLQIPAPSATTPPIKDIDGNPWQEWNGRTWKGDPAIKCRPSYHGYGVEKVSAAGEERQGGAPGRSRRCAATPFPRLRSPAVRYPRLPSLPLTFASLAFTHPQVSGESMCFNTLSSASDTQHQGKAGKGSTGRGRSASPARMAAA